MATLKQMRDRIADQLDRSDLSDQIDKEINLAINHYSDRKWWFFEEVSTFVTVDGTRSYTTAGGLPEILSLENVKITVNSNDVSLIPTPWATMDVMEVGNLTGQPIRYAIFQQEMYLYPIPDASYTVTVAYDENIAATELSADGDSNAFSNNLEDLIEARAMWGILNSFIGQDDDAQRAKVRESEALGAAIRKNNRYLLSRGSVVPATF